LGHTQFEAEVEVLGSHLIAEEQSQDSRLSAAFIRMKNTDKKKKRGEYAFDFHENELEGKYRRKVR
jgi:hypothetical protein